MSNNNNNLIDIDPCPKCRGPKGNAYIYTNKKSNLTIERCNNIVDWDTGLYLDPDTYIETGKPKFCANPIRSLGRGCYKGQDNNTKIEQYDLLYFVNFLKYYHEHFSKLAIDYPNAKSTKQCAILCAKLIRTVENKDNKF